MKNLHKLTSSLICSLTIIGIYFPNVEILAQEANKSCADANTQLDNSQEYDVIIFGDEIPGVMTAIKVKRE